jgi:hypothetical protein
MATTTNINDLAGQIERREPEFSRTGNQNPLPPDETIQKIDVGEKSGTG